MPTSNILSIYAFFAYLTSLVTLLLSFLVYSKNRKNPINISFALWTLSGAIWSFGLASHAISTSKSMAIYWDRILHGTATLVPVFFLFFVLAILGKIKTHKKILVLAFIIDLIILSFANSKFFISDELPKLYFSYFPEPGIIYYVFTVMFIIYVVYACYLLIKEYICSSGVRRNQLKYLFLGSGLAFIGGSTTFPLVFNIRVFPYGIFLIPPYSAIIAYAILKHRLMDIRVAITRTGIFVAVYTLILGLPFALAGWFKDDLINIFGAHWWKIPLGLMAILATAGPFIYIYVERKAEERLLREQKRYQDVLRQASLGMTRIRNLKKLLNLITHIVTKTVRISYVGIYLYNKDTDEYVLQVSRDKGRMPVPKLNFDNPLISWIAFKREPLVYEEIKRQMQDFTDPIYKHLEENMRLLTASVVLPSFLEDKFMGFIVLGDKMSGQIYTPDDLDVFEILASQAALAIENAQFYEEAKEMQGQIAQAEKMATIGTMADGLSHQINNRFHALSLIAGDTIDTIKLTDTSKCTPEVKEMITQINHALERVQANVMQGSEVVKGILKYSRKGEEGFEPLSIDQILDATLEMVQYKVKLSDIDIVRNYPKDTPKIKGNLTQLEEVFFNFIDNAYDAIMERRDLLKENAYRGRITVGARPKDSKLEIVIEDNGLGIKGENDKKMFTPFFTTKTSSRKGTGLGLYVIKRIITDSHQGRITFESQYKVGTRFFVELPIAK